MGPAAYALLIEQCVPGAPLGQVLPEPDRDHVVAGLLARLWAQPHGARPFRPLVQMCAAWAAEFEQDYAAAAAAERIDPGLARARIALFRELPQPADEPVLLATDPHTDNILAAWREPWQVIDPKPYIGATRPAHLGRLLPIQAQMGPGSHPGPTANVPQRLVRGIPPAGTRHR